MFCPRCKDEYREGFTICSNCNIPLVDKLPEEENQDINKEDESIEYVTILSTFNPADISIIKSILDGENIDFFFKGEYVLLVQPFLEPASLIVRRDQAEEVKEILKDLKLTFIAK